MQKYLHGSKVKSVKQPIFQSGLSPIPIIFTLFPTDKPSNSLF